MTFLAANGTELRFCSLTCYGEYRPSHVARSELEAERAVSAALRAKINRMRRAVELYFEQYGAEHSDPDCPEDDTCTCPLVVEINKPFVKGEYE